MSKNDFEAAQVTPHNIAVCKNGRPLLQFEPIGYEAAGFSSEENPAMVQIPYHNRFDHTLILGITGCGKSTKLMLPMIKQDIETTDAAIVVIDGKGTTSEAAAQMAKSKGRKVLHFDPMLSECPFFNPLAGTEEDAIDAVVTAFAAVNPDDSQAFKDLNELLLRNCIKVLKRLDKAKCIDGKYATLLNLSLLINDYDRGGRYLIQKFSRISAVSKEEAKENADIAAWFLSVYYENSENICENTAGVGAFLVKIFNDSRLRRVFDPDIDEGEMNQLDFEQGFAKKMVMCVTGSDSLGLKGAFLNALIEQKLKQAIAHRPQECEGAFLYIDEFQMFSQFCEMLPHLKNKQIALHAAMMSRKQLPEDSRNLVDVYVKNIITLMVMPPDALFYAIRLNSFYQALAELRGEAWEDKTTQIRTNLLAVNGDTVFYYLICDGKRAEPGLGTVLDTAC